MDPPEVGPRRSPGLSGPEGANSTPPTIVATCSPVLGILTSIAGTAEQRAKPGTGSTIPRYPMDPPEVGPRRSRGLSGPEGPSTELLACATWRSAEWGAYGSVLQAAGEEAKRGPGWVGGILHTLGSYGTSISRSQTVSGSVRS